MSEGSKAALERRGSGLWWSSVAAALALLAGCSATKARQLEEVAKDWNKVIRASQVIPIYPLSQDLQPGDVFLVQTPIEEQQSLWNKSGYLPLDYQLARIQPDGYLRYYEDSFIDESAPPVLPKDWLGGEAPSAAFPSYSFSVRRGGGLNLAVPVSGVPVGLSLLGADAAEGTLSLGRARTFGIDLASLQRQVQVWALEQRDLLRDFQPEEGSPPRNYLRVVSRVYYVGSIDLSLRSADQVGAGLDAGAPKPVELLTLDPARETGAASAQDYADGLKALNAMLKEGRAASDAAALLPGGSLRISAASARSIAMTELFDPPLVVGYLGYDLPILAGGFTGRPIPTHSMLTGRAPAEARERVAGSAVGAVYEDTLGPAAYQVLRSRENDPRALAITESLDGLFELLGEARSNYSIDREGRLTVRQPARAAGTEPYTDFRASVGAKERSRSALTEALQAPRITLVRPDGSTSTIEHGSAEAESLALELSSLQAEILRLRAAEAPRVRTAIAYLNSLMNP